MKRNLGSTGFHVADSRRHFSKVTWFLMQACHIPNVT